MEGDGHYELDHDGDPGEGEVPVEEVELWMLDANDMSRRTHVVAASANDAAIGVVFP
jgi:hypothetical protein